MINILSAFLWFLHIDKGDRKSEFISVLKVALSAEQWNTTSQPYFGYLRWSYFVRGGEKDCLGSVYGEATFVPVYLAFSVLCEAICTALYCFKKLGKMCNWDLLVYFLLFEKVELRTVLIFWEYSVQKSDSLKQVPKIKKKVTKKETWVIHLLLYFDNLLFDIYPILSKMFDFRMELKMSGNTQTLSRHFL